MTHCKHEDAPEVWQHVGVTVLRECPTCHCVQYANDPKRSWYPIKRVSPKCAHDNVSCGMDAHDNQMLTCLNCGRIKYLSEVEEPWHTPEELGITKTEDVSSADHLDLAFQVRAYTTVELALKAKCPGRNPQGGVCGCEVQLRFQTEEQDWVLSCAGNSSSGVESCGWFAYGTTLLNAAKARFV